MSRRRRYRCCSRCDTPGHTVRTCPKPAAKFKMPTKTEMPRAYDRGREVMSALDKGRLSPAVASTHVYHLTFECLQELRWHFDEVSALLRHNFLTDDRRAELKKWMDSTVDRHLVEMRERFTPLGGATENFTMGLRAPNPEGMVN